MQASEAAGEHPIRQFWQAVYAEPIGACVRLATGPGADVRAREAPRHRAIFGRLAEGHARNAAGQFVGTRISRVSELAKTGTMTRATGLGPNNP